MFYIIQRFEPGNIGNVGLCVVSPEEYNKADFPVGKFTTRLGCQHFFPDPKAAFSIQGLEMLSQFLKTLI